MKYCKAFGQQAWAWPGHFKPDSLLYVCVCVHVCVWACAHGMGMNKYIVISILICVWVWVCMCLTFDVVAEYKQFLEARLGRCRVSWENKMPK